jgi:hypothetical protein
MTLFRPKMDWPADKEKAPREKKGRSVEHVEKAECDAIEPAGPADHSNIKALEEKIAKAEERVNRARSRLEQIEGDLLLTEEQDEAEDLRAEQKDAQARLDKARAGYDKAKLELDQVKAKHHEEARVEAEMQSAVEADEKIKMDEAIKRAKVKAKAGGEPGRKADTLFPKDRWRAETEPGLAPPPEEECVPVEVMEEGELGPMPKPRKKFKWTPKKAIAVGAVLFLILPVVLYTVVVPRVDVTVRSWYYEGFQNSIVVDTKVINDGSVEVRNLDINVSVLKVVNGLEVYITQLTGQTMSIGSYSEKKFSSIELHDDQNDRYVLLVRVSFDAGSRSVHESYTHHIDGPYMNIYFEDHIAELAI